MLKLTAALRYEHEKINSMLEVLKSIVALLKADQAIDIGHPAKVVYFLRNYADRFHHSREVPLFEVMEKQLPDDSDEMVGHLTAEHTLFRLLVDSLAEAADSYASGRSDAGRDFAETADAYGALLFHHICQEDNVLFPMAENNLSPSAQSEIEKSSQKLKMELSSGKTEQECLVILDDLVSAYEVTVKGNSPG